MQHTKRTETVAEKKRGISMEKGTTAAVVLAAGQGKRMQAGVPKQYLQLNGYPVLYYSLKAFEESAVDQIVLVTGAGEVEYCKKEIVQRYGFGKVSRIVTGGRERYHSVYAGLQAAEGADYVLIHDGARPFVTLDIISRTLEGARNCGACVAGMPVKDTIKIVDEAGFAKVTPERSKVWMVQTPQTFSYAMIFQAYDMLIKQEKMGKTIQVTDDAMVLETVSGRPSKLVEGSYENIKITTPEDLTVAEAFGELKR